MLYPLGAGSEFYLAYSVLPPAVNLPIVGPYLGTLFQTLGLGQGASSVGFWASKIGGQSWGLMDVVRGGLLTIWPPCKHPLLFPSSLPFPFLGQTESLRVLPLPLVSSAVRSLHLHDLSAQESARPGKDTRGDEKEDLKGGDVAFFEGGNQARFGPNPHVMALFYRSLSSITSPSFPGYFPLHK